MTTTPESRELIPVRPASARLDLQQCRSIGEIAAKSKFFKDSQQEAQAVMKVLAGREIGLPPFASMTGIYFVQGRLTLSANAMATLIQKYVFEGTNATRFKFRVKNHSRTGCSIVFYERESPASDWEEVGTSEFTAEDQKTAGLRGDNWTKYPRNMMYARAMSNGAKWYCPAVFAGHTPYLPDEVDQSAKATAEGEYVVDGKVVQAVPDAPAPAEEEEVPDAEVVGENPYEAGTPLHEVFALIEETGTETKKVLEHYDVRSLDELDDDAIRNCIQTLQAKKSAR